MSLLPHGPWAALVLEDGSVHRGTSFGRLGVPTAGEVVFHTGMCGYPEILTDPSYRGQIVVLTYPHAGNYRMPPGDDESGRIQVAGLVVHRLCRHPSGVRGGPRLEEAMDAAGILGLEGVDTRAITHRVREGGSLRGRVVTLPSGMATGDPLPPEWIERAVAQTRELPSMEGQELASSVSLASPVVYPPLDGFAMGGGAWAERPVRSADQPTLELALLHMGAKDSIVDQLRARGCRVHALPHDASAEEVLAIRPHGLLVSNGPGDPSTCGAAIAAVEGLLGRVPLLGICLGHQILCLAAGARTYKLPFGHHGANHPVRDERDGRIAISSQNHGFSVDENSLRGTGLRVSHRSLYDGTVEGVEGRELMAWGIQYHPEAAPGPHDARGVFDDFVSAMRSRPGDPVDDGSKPPESFRAMGGEA